MNPSKPRGRKLLVATIGLATISYVACTTTETSGNLVAPPPDTDAAADAPPPTSGNLMPPPPMDAGPDVEDASKDAPEGG